MEVEIMGLDLNDYLGGDYLSSKDIEENKEWVIKSVEEKDFDGTKKLNLNLEHNGTEKSLTLNITNTKRIITCFGSKSEDAVGKVVVLKTVETEYKGESFQGIRVDEELTKSHKSNK